MRPSSVHTTMPLAPAAKKEGACPGSGPVSGRIEHQNPCKYGRFGSSTVAGQAGAGKRHGESAELIDGLRAEVIIPLRSHRKTPRTYDKALYKERNVIEHFFNKLKQFRRIASRYDKLLVNFMGVVKIAALAIWLR